MDRLEKALKKARSMRDAAQAPPPAKTEPAKAVAFAEAAIRPGSRQTELETGVLERNRIVARGTRDANADIIRILRTKVLRLMTDNNMKTLAVTSPNSGDGKTTVAINLALSLALDVKQTVLLVDLDLRGPDIHSYLGIQPDKGLNDYLLHDVPVAECMVDPGIERLKVLPISAPLDNSSEILGTPKMAKFGHELKTRYADRIVIYDMPPLLTQDDALTFLPYVDGVLLVVRDGVTYSNEVSHCLNILGTDKLLGTVLNGCSEPSFNRE